MSAGHIFRTAFDPAFVDWDAYLLARYQPAPALRALTDYELIASGWGGIPHDPYASLDDHLARQVRPR